MSLSPWEVLIVVVACVAALVFGVAVGAWVSYVLGVA